MNEIARDVTLRVRASSGFVIAMVDRAFIHTPSQRYERVHRIVHRQALDTRLALLCAPHGLRLTLVIGGERLVLVQPGRSFPAARDVAHATDVVVVPVELYDSPPIELEVVGEAAYVSLVASIAAQWVSDVLHLEDEMNSLSQEIVHSYEELHLLYNLGGALSVILNVAAACDLIVEAVLDPLDAVYATITLKHEGDTQVIHRSTNRETTGPVNPNARATASLQVGGKYIGTLAVYGKRTGGDFTSGDYKLLDGVASVSAPVLHNAQLYEAACQQAQTDSLTGVYNHRRIQEHLETNLERARQYGTTISIIVAEVDHLALLNDVYGLSIGNAALRLMADCLRVSIRPGDAVGSYGEDKFIVVLPNTNAHDADNVARRILSTVRARELTVDGDKLAMRVSLGIAAFPEHGIGKQPLIAAAVDALQEASAAGGATVRSAGYVHVDPRFDGEAFSVLQGLVRAVDAKDHYTQEHSEVVTHAALLLAERLGLPEDMRHALRLGAMLHDVGKIGIPDSVLKKPGKLTPKEYEIMKQHVVLSELIVRGIPQPPGVLDAVAFHHERYDGLGYPYGKHGEDIPLLGRIMAIADAYSAMCIDRPYRKGLTWDDIRHEFEEGAETQFDPVLVDVFIEAVEELRSRGQHIDSLVSVLSRFS